ncbi:MULTISPECIES: hypothetical protein [Lysobacter]|jgi:hypothetical protein|uniref:hypothetical protein n=1 Tax=Lysobacter TaxID=68 RepID=UPI001F28AF21|nr:MULTISPECIES: hypothetical protein [Lysobacter]UJB20428.1 hypothetical protein L1A79_04925 [Lysobacter capsici]UJQ30458.1 hypothetical protein L2D09_09935 [Lysobacter gummosus]
MPPLPGQPWWTDARRHRESHPSIRDVRRIIAVRDVHRVSSAETRKIQEFSRAEEAGLHACAHRNRLLRGCMTQVTNANVRSHRLWLVDAVARD